MDPLPTWESVRSFVRQNGFALYKAPLNTTPVKVPAKNNRKNMTIRIYASKIDREADDFTADSAHLDRFYSD